MFGSGFRIALGRFKFLWRSSKWLKSCRITHRFAESYVDKAVEYRKNLASGEGSTGSGKDRDRKHKTLLYAMAEQTEDRMVLRNEILQALMAAQETTAVLISNVLFLLSRHPNVWEKLREEVASLENEELNMDLLLSLKYLRNVLDESKILQRILLSQRSADVEFCLQLSACIRYSRK